MEPQQGASTSTPKISVVINTRNAAEFLPQVLDSVAGFDEVVVVDMDSSDNTVQLARDAGAQVYHFPTNGVYICEVARDFAIHKASNRYVLVVDADELVTDELRQYLYRLVGAPDCPAGLWIPRQNKFADCWEHTIGDHQLRFFDQTVTTWPTTIHAHPQVGGVVQKVPQSERNVKLMHLVPNYLADVFEKTNRYTTLEVGKRAHKHYGIASLLLRPPLFALKRYFLQGAWRDGVPGLLNALSYGNYQFCWIAKHIESRLLVRRREH